MFSTSAIPRFLLPRRSARWRTRFSTPSANRHASKGPSKSPSKKSTKPLVLEKPTKFNPPSHGARIRKDPPRYPGPQLSTEETARQNSKKYPNMMPPEGTFMHWFMNNKSIHMYIALVCLFTTLVYHNMANGSIEYAFYSRWNSMDHEFQAQFSFCRHATSMESTIPTSD
jgi:hypothetical protein